MSCTSTKTTQASSTQHSHSATHSSQQQQAAVCIDMAALAQLAECEQMEMHVVDWSAPDSTGAQHPQRTAHVVRRAQRTAQQSHTVQYADTAAQMAVADSVGHSEATHTEQSQTTPTHQRSRLFDAIGWAVSATFAAGLSILLWRKTL